MSKPKRRNALKPRKFPRQTRSSNTVAAILEAAARILERDGFGGYTTNAVADRAGVSIGSFYQYFPHKDSLTAALIERETRTLLEEIAAVAPGSTCADGLLSLIRAAIAHQMRRPALARLLDFEEQRLALEQRDQCVADAIAALVIRLLSRPDAPAVPNSSVAAHDVLAIVKGVVDAAGQRGETDSANLQRRVERAVKGYLAESSRAHQRR